ncbi:MAG: response regulator [Mycobacteriales bacterium]
MTRLVLLVEDAPEIAMLVEALLPTLGDVEVVTATDGVAGLELARSLQPDLVLLDLTLPRLDGPAVLGQLRADVATRDLHVVLFTGAGDVDAAALARLGADDLLPKPFTADALLSSVGRLLRRDLAS